MVAYCEVEMRLQNPNHQHAARDFRRPDAVEYAPAICVKNSQGKRQENITDSSSIYHGDFSSFHTYSSCKTQPLDVLNANCRVGAQLSESGLNVTCYGANCHSLAYNHNTAKFSCTNNRGSIVITSICDSQEGNYTKKNNLKTVEINFGGPTRLSEPFNKDSSSLFRSRLLRTDMMHSTNSIRVKVVSLFTFGVIFAVLLNFLQKQKRVIIFSPGLFADGLNSAWWVPPTFGLASIIIGLVYPLIDKCMGRQHKPLYIEWTSVTRCTLFLVGINHACAKLNFDSNTHMTMVLGVLSMGLWYFFDQSLYGLVLASLITGIATIVTQLLAALHIFGYSNPDFWYMTSWVPFLYFSGGITVGTFGRALASVTQDGQVFNNIKEHQD